MSKNDFNNDLNKIVSLANECNNNNNNILLSLITEVDTFTDKYTSFQIICKLKKYIPLVPKNKLVDLKRTMWFLQAEIPLGNLGKSEKIMYYDNIVSKGAWPTVGIDLITRTQENKDLNFKSVCRYGDKCRFCDPNDNIFSLNHQKKYAHGKKQKSKKKSKKKKSKKIKSKKIKSKKKSKKKILRRNLKRKY
jgi:hypothetical protein